MRFATYRVPGLLDAVESGVVDGDRVYPFPDGRSLLDVVRLGLPAAVVEGTRALDHGASRPLADVLLQVPLQPPSVRDFVAFEEHVEGVRRCVEGRIGVPGAWYDAPTFYFTNPHTLVATGAEVVVPATSRALDFELEVAVVVGAAGRSLSVEAAGERVFGYTILGDWSARDLQRREMEVGLGPAKGKDFATTLGPWIVTADELEPYRDADGFLDLWCSVTVNGTPIGRDLLSNMGWTFETLIAYASRDSRVEPGDVLGSGTVGNGGCLAELWGRRAMQDPPALGVGDVVAMTVEGIGTVANRVVSGEPPPPLPPVRRGDPATSRARRADGASIPSAASSGRRP